MSAKRNGDWKAGVRLPAPATIIAQDAVRRRDAAEGSAALLAALRGYFERGGIG